MLNIKIQIPDSKLAFRYLKSSIRQLDWYIQNGRSNRLDYFKNLNNPIINQIIDDRSLPTEIFDNKYFELFHNNLYNPAVLNPIYTKRVGTHTF